MPLSDDEKLISALRDAVHALAEVQVPAVIIGGVAVSFLARARATRDVDALIFFDTSSVTWLLQTLKDRGFEPRFADMEEFAQQNRFLTVSHVATGITVDVALGCMPFEAETIERSTAFQHEDFIVRLPTPEDLIILKAIANRPQDRADIVTIVEVYPDLDRKRVRKWVEQYGELLETPDLWNQTALLLDGKAV